MAIVGALCLGAAAASAIFGLWSISRPSSGDPAQLLTRALAPTQLAAAVMLASGGAVALAAPQSAVVIVITCIVGAVGTVAAGSWQSARYAVRRQPAAVDCGGSCAFCTQSCR